MSLTILNVELDHISCEVLMKNELNTRRSLKIMNLVEHRTIHASRRTIGASRRDGQEWPGAQKCLMRLDF